MARTLHLDRDYEFSLRYLKRSTVNRKWVGADGLTVVGFWASTNVPDTNGVIPPIDPDVQVTLTPASGETGGYYGYIDRAALLEHCKQFATVYRVIEISGDDREVVEFSVAEVNEVE